MQYSSKLMAEYDRSDTLGKIDLILHHFSTFPSMIESSRRGLCYLVLYETDQKRHDPGALGVRVQSSGTSDPTAQKSIREIGILKAIETCDFSDLIDDKDMTIRFTMEAVMIRNMHEDYRLVKSQLGILNISDREMLESYLTTGKQIKEIADEQDLTYATTKQRIRRARHRIREQLYPYLERKYNTL